MEGLTVTNDEAAARQAVHENLLREMAKVIKQARDDYGVALALGGAWCARADVLIEAVLGEGDAGIEG
jgi:hypothetical protein